MRVLIIQNCELENLGIYERHFVDNNISINIVHSYREPLPSHNHYDVLIIGGTPDSAYNRREHPYLNSVFGLITEAVKNEKPCFGVCCGAQLLAIVLGSYVYRNTVMEIGCYEVTITSDGENDPLLKGFPKYFPVFQWHGDTFEVPRGANLIVTGKQCTNQVFRFGNIVGVQFHLEVSADEAKKWAEKYSNELSEVGKTIDQVVEGCRVHGPKMKELASLLMSNYLNFITKGV